jgi:hypothetical protein
MWKNIRLKLTDTSILPVTLKKVKNIRLNLTDTRILSVNVWKIDEKKNKVKFDWHKYTPTTCVHAGLANS